MSIHPSKQRDAQAAVVRNVNSAAVKKIDVFLGKTAKTLDSKVIQAMSLAAGASAFTMPSIYGYFSVSPELAYTAGIITTTVFAVSNYAEFYSSPARQGVYIPGKQHSVQDHRKSFKDLKFYLNSFTKAKKMRQSYNTSKSGDNIHELGHTLADAMADKMFWLRKSTNFDFARLFMKSYPIAEATQPAEKERLKRMDKTMDTYRFARYTNPASLEQSIDDKLTRREQNERNLPSDFDYNLVQLFAMAANDNTAISRIIQESPLAQWLEPLFDNHQQILDAFKNSRIDTRKDMVGFVRDMHYALGDLTPLVLGEGLSNYDQLKEYEKLTIKCLGDALDQVQTNVLQQSLCEDISEFIHDIYERGETVPLKDMLRLVTRLNKAVEGRRLHAQSATNPYPTAADAKLGDIPALASLLGHLYSDALQQGKTGISALDLTTLTDLDGYFQRIINTTLNTSPEDRVSNLASTLHQLALGTPIAQYDEKALHAQWFDNLFKEIHTRALTGIQKMPTAALKVEYLDELLQEYPSRLENLGSHRRRANFGKAIISESISTASYSVKSLCKGGVSTLSQWLGKTDDPVLNQSAAELTHARQTISAKLNEQSTVTPAPPQPTASQQPSPQRNN